MWLYLLRCHTHHSEYSDTYFIFQFWYVIWPWLKVSLTILWTTVLKIRVQLCSSMWDARAEVVRVRRWVSISENTCRPTFPTRRRVSNFTTRRRAANEHLPHHGVLKLHKIRLDCSHYWNELTVFLLHLILFVLLCVNSSELECWKPWPFLLSLCDLCFILRCAHL